MSRPTPGDIVRLKSGSPVMTVESIEDSLDGLKAKCSWFVGPELRTALINLEALERTTETASEKLTMLR